MKGVAVVAVLLVACRSSRPTTPETPSPGSGPPVARTVDVVEEKFGIKVADPYRWMEGDDNPERDKWLAAHGAYTANQLASLPERESLFKRVRELGLGSSSIGSPTLAGGKRFYMETAANEQRAKLVMRTPEGLRRVLLDPNTVEGVHSIDNFTPTADGNVVAFNWSTDGAEVTKVRVMTTSNQQERPDVIERVWGEFFVTWLPDGSGFFYTQMAPTVAGADPLLDMRVRFHRLGAPPADDPIVWMRGVGGPAVEAQEFPWIIEIRDGWILGVVGGARQERRIAVAKLADFDAKAAKPTLTLRAVAEYTDLVDVATIHADRLYLLSRKGAPNRRLLVVPLAKPELASAKVEIAEATDAVLSDVAVATDALYVNDLVEGRGRVRRLVWGGQDLSLVKLPFEGTVRRISTDPRAAGAVVDMTGWTRPAEHFAYDEATNALVPAGTAATTNADFSNVVAEVVSVKAPDGQAIPMTTIHKQDQVADGTHATILVGYGAFAIPMLPSFDATALAWLERGGIVAVCHVRGGGEKGDRWYTGGVRANKLVGIRDFVACADALVARNWTTPTKLAAHGSSAGGILVGRAIVEKPTAFGAAVIQVGIVNPLRMLHAPNGANLVAEFGSPDTPEGFKQIHTIDPYVQLDPKQAYPATLFTVGLKDGRVTPWMTAKMAARMLAGATTKPVWVRIDAKAGHGIGSGRDQTLAERADIYAFALANLH